MMVELAVRTLLFFPPLLLFWFLCSSSIHLFIHVWPWLVLLLPLTCLIASIRGPTFAGGRFVAYVATMVGRCCGGIRTCAQRHRGSWGQMVEVGNGGRRKEVLTWPCLNVIARFGKSRAAEDVRVGCGCKDCDMGGWDRMQKKMRRIEERKKGGRTLYTQPFPFRLSGPSLLFSMFRWADICQSVVFGV